MEPTLLVSIISPMVAFSAGLAVLLFHLRGKQEATYYENEIKALRRSLLQGKIGHKGYTYVRDNLKVEDLFKDESKRLDEMFKQNLMDEDTYARMKKVLQLTFNDKLVKIYDHYQD